MSPPRKRRHQLCGITKAVEKRKKNRSLAYFGLGTLNAWQIAYAVNSLISLCRGIDATCLFAGL